MTTTNRVKSNSGHQIDSSHCAKMFLTSCDVAPSRVERCLFGTLTGCARHARSSTSYTSQPLMTCWKETLRKNPSSLMRVFHVPSQLFLICPHPLKTPLLNTLWHAWTWKKSKCYCFFLACLYTIFLCLVYVVKRISRQNLHSKFWKIVTDRLFTWEWRMVRFLSWIVLNSSSSSFSSEGSSMSETPSSGS